MRMATKEEESRQGRWILGAGVMVFIFIVGPIPMSFPAAMFNLGDSFPKVFSVITGIGTMILIGTSKGKKKPLGKDFQNQKD